jgi:hypothetical protein
MFPVLSPVPGLVETTVVSDQHVLGIGRVEENLVVIHMDTLSTEALEGHTFVRCAVDVHVHGAETTWPVGVSKQLTVVLRINDDVVALLGPSLAVVGGAEEAALVVLGGHQGVDNPGL